VYGPQQPPPPSDEATVTVDTSKWPLVVLTYAGKPDQELLARHLKEVEDRVLTRGEPFVQIIDQSRGEMPDAVQRAMIAAHQRKMDRAYRKFCLGEAYVVSPNIGGAMVAVFWLAKPPCPYTFVEDFGAALAWAQARLKEGGRES
jgi:hypothetical protein